MFLHADEALLSSSLNRGADVLQKSSPVAAAVPDVWMFSSLSD